MTTSGDLLCATPGCLACDRLTNSVAACSVSAQQEQDRLRDAVVVARQHGVPLSELALAAGLTTGAISRMIAEATLW